VNAAATRVAALVSGEMDVVIDPAVQDLDRLRQSPNVQVQQGNGLGAQFMGFDHGRDKLNHAKAGEKNPFKDPRVREAFRLAIDKEAIRAKVLRGMAGVNRALFTPAVDGYDKEFDRPAAYDPARAKALLKEAGYPDGFSVELDCSAQQPADAICQAVSSMLARIGIKVDYRPLQFNILLPKLITGDTSLYIIGWTPATVEPEGVLVPLAHAKTPDGAGEYNFGKYHNPKVDELIDRGRVEFDAAKRAQLFSEAMKAMDAEAAFIPLANRHVVWAMRKGVKVKTRPNDILDLRFVNVE